MIFCRCCGTKLNEKSQYGWHNACIKRFFSANEIPSINELKNIIEDIENNFILKNKSVTGVQQKLSSSLSFSFNKKKTLMGQAEYIIKPDTSEFPNIAEAENLVMNMALISGIDVVEHGLIDYENGYIYLTKRIDRILNNKIHMEDFCQLSNKPTSYKYVGSYEQCARIINKYSSSKRLDNTKLLERLIFCYIIGNSDMHLKNFSLIENDDSIRLSKAYDLLPVNLIYPNDNDFTALSLNGKRRNQTLKDFISFGKSIEINENIVCNMTSKLLSFKDKYYELIDDSLLSIDYKEKFKALIQERMNMLKSFK